MNITVQNKWSDSGKEIIEFSGMSMWALAVKVTKIALHNGRRDRPEGCRLQITVVSISAQMRILKNVCKESNLYIHRWHGWRGPGWGRTLDHWVRLPVNISQRISPSYTPSKSQTTCLTYTFLYNSLRQATLALLRWIAQGWPSWSEW